MIYFGVNMKINNIKYKDDTTIYKPMHEIKIASKFVKNGSSIEYN